jgi:bis(5'-nucleosyl)-tetraphosphatase (symmetrical)
MTDYVVGDIQGCFDSLIALLDQIEFNKEHDTLYCVGDLVNRGPKSLETLEFLHSLGKSAKVVLGNHDLHLISCHYGIRGLKKNDTAQSVLASPKADFYINWLRQQPLIIYNNEKDFVISHAGLYPKWTLKQGLYYSEIFCNMLKSNKYLILLEKIYGNKPDKFNMTLSKAKKWLFTVNAFTRMRYCTKDAKLDFEMKGSPTESDTLIPWFQLKNKRDKNTRYIFGHWSSLNLYKLDNVIGIDTGCVWGHKLTIYNVDNDQFIQQTAID